jgi:hypothetical protein
MHDRVVVQPRDRAARTVGAPPVRTELEGPPSRPVVQINGMPGRRKDERPGPQHVRKRARVIRSLRLQFRKGHVAGGVDEAEKLAI